MLRSKEGMTSPVAVPHRTRRRWRRSGKFSAFVEDAGERRLQSDKTIVGLKNA